MKKYKHSGFVFLLFLTFAGADAQQGVLKFTANYALGIPTGNFKKLTDEVSVRGWSASVLYGLTDGLSLGAEVGFQDFYKKFGRAVLHEGGSDVSAVVTNSIQTMPILIKGKYEWMPEGNIKPFAALGLGGNFIVYNKYYGQFSDSYSNFGFAAQPEVGLGIPFGRSKRSNFQLAAAYNIMPFSHNDADGVHHAVVKAGITIPMR